ncbi:YqaE/Pmp3 family membrane protein [uncultured Alteromonas sp.]|uniref:YqaE/Pmp3 family membrane protein n=1 Tax=uncultured Alteromonas sp. TaxID=179113 RepID=UPI0025CFC720|nr:YqaE/Pmp3 family membrane protein [uncultured Alteromonas sp.]
MNSTVMFVLAVLLPPLAVYLTSGPGNRFWLNLVLTMLGFVPGVLHALYTVITSRQV